jgi:tetratricopeptide (TPR) repeat protein
MGDQVTVMRSFLAARKKAKAEADAKRAAAPKEGPQGAYAEALRLYGEGNLDEALPRFEQAIEEDPENIELRVTYANVLYKAKKFEPFEGAARAALELQPGNRDLLMMLYSSRRGRGDLKGALESLLMLKEAGAPDADLQQHLNFVAKKMGRSRNAVPAYEAILEIDPDNVDAYLSLASIYATSDAGRSNTYLAKAVELAPDHAARIYFDLGSELLVGGKASDRAVAMLQKTTELDPGMVMAYKKLGLALWQREDYAGTRQAFEKYLELDPDADDLDQIQEYLDQLPE